MEQRKPRVTARKYMGDDAYSWAVFIDGRPAFTGLCRAQVAHYRKLAADGYKDAMVKCLDKSGYYDQEPK